MYSIESLLFGASAYSSTDIFGNPATRLLARSCKEPAPSLHNSDMARDVAVIIGLLCNQPDNGQAGKPT
jgi:hypothetical protein